MISRVLRLNIKQPFGRVENPLWQVAQLTKSTDQNSIVRGNLTNFVPADSFNLREQSDFQLENDSVFQTYVSLENLKDPFVLKLLNQNQRVQFWIDRIISKVESAVLITLLNEFEKIELVYLPDLHSHPQVIFENFFSELDGRQTCLTIQLKLKESSFDRWLSPIELWDRILWLQQSQIFFISTQVLDIQINKFPTPEEKLFVLNPTYETLLVLLRAREKTKYFTQVVLTAVFNLSGATCALFLRQLLSTLISPSKQNFLSLIRLGKIPLSYLWRLRDRIWELRNLIIFYPFRKFYWILEHAIKKRLPRKLNESDQRGDSSVKV